MKFHKIRDFDSLTTIEPKKLNIMIEDYIMSRIGKSERASLNRSLSVLDLFFSMNDITLNFKKNHDKNADCPYCLAEFDVFDEYDD